MKIWQATVDAIRQVDDARVLAPDIETRVAILEKKAEQEGIELPQEVAIFLATLVAAMGALAALGTDRLVAVNRRRR